MGNILTRSEKQKADKLHHFLKNYSTIMEIQSVKCKACNGSGLSGTTKLNNGQGFSWNGEYCPVCRGTGYIDFRDNNEFAICSSCNGTGGSGAGCPKCNGRGVVDWVEAMRMGVKTGITNEVEDKEMEESLATIFPQE